MTSEFVFLHDLRRHGQRFRVAEYCGWRVVSHYFDPDPAEPNKEIPQMKGLIASVLFAILFVGPVLADSPRATSKDQAVIDAVKQVEQDMGKAMVAGDIDKLKQIYADDFATFGSSGRTITKQDLLSDFESFHDRLAWFENGPMDVQVFDNVAVAQGSVKEVHPTKFTARIFSVAAPQGQVFPVSPACA